MQLFFRVPDFWLAGTHYSREKDFIKLQQFQKNTRMPRGTSGCCCVKGDERLRLKSAKMRAGGPLTQASKISNSMKKTDMDMFMGPWNTKIKAASNKPVFIGTKASPLENKLHETQGLVCFYPLI